MNIAQSVFWHQGLFLQPQHFQHLERQMHFAHSPFVRMLNPYPWGIESITIAESAIANRMLEIREIKALLPDQVFLQYPGNLQIAARSFDKAWTNPDQPLSVYLAIRRFSSANANVTVVDSVGQACEVDTRFASLSNPASQRDVYSQGSEALVPTIVYVAKIIFNDEVDSLDDHDVIALVQLARDGEQVRLASNKVAPVVALQASDTLKYIVRDIRDEMLGRLRQLEEYKSPRGVNAQDLDANFLMMMQAVQVLNRHVPALTHVLEAPAVHPWDVYGMLRQCVGELSTFSHRFDVYGRTATDDLGLPAYDHNDLGSCFVSARDLVGRLLGEIAMGPEFSVTLQLQDAYYLGSIPAEFFSGRYRFYLVLQSEQIHELSSEQVMGSVRMAAPTAIPELIDYALPGIELFELPGPPQGLPRRTDARYFRIEQVSEGWQMVQEQSAVAFYWPDAPEDTRIVVVVTKG